MILKSVQLGTCPGLILLLLSSYADAQRNSDFRPAAANVSKESAAGAELFNNEAIQLTDSVLVDLKNDDDFAQYAPLFAFGNDSNGNEEEDCKTYPGDPQWPSEELWGAFDELLGYALSPIVPIASPCYTDSEYDNYDASLCASVSEGWTKESTQSVARIFARWLFHQLTGR